MLLSTLGVEASSLQEALSQTSVEGYVRGTYQSHDVSNDRVYQDDAIGGKIHLETGAISGVSMGTSLYTSNALLHHDNGGLIPLRGESDQSYAIVGEAYLQSEFGKNIVRIGRQEIDTPFTQIDDIGMVPNTFEAITLQNTTLNDTRLFFGHLREMAGVDASVVDKFTALNGQRGVQVVGVSYAGVEDLELQGWYYRLHKAQVDRIAFLEADYERSIKSMSYGIGLQYAKQDYALEEDAKLYGITLSAALDPMGLIFSGAYTKVEGNAVTSGFGGGPFYSNSEYLIVDNAGADGEAMWYGVEYAPTSSRLEGLTLALGRVSLVDKQGEEATEVDWIMSYELNKNLELHGVFSNLKASHVDEDDAKHLRVFANYHF